MKKLEIKVKLNEYDDARELESSERELLDKAKLSLDYSYSPYSQFKVGAAILMGNGEVVLGSNQENSSFPAGICAERSAIYSAVHLHRGVKIEAIAITVESEDFEVSSPIAPCGICRQVLLEYELKQKQALKIILQGTKGKIYTIPSAKALLPIYFFEKGLKKG